MTADEFYPTQVKTKPHWMTYGLGWFQQDYRGKMIQYHTGSLDGSIAIHGFVPEEKFSIYLFANLDHSELRHAIMWKAIDLWSFNDNSRDWSTELFTLYKTRRETARKAVKEKEAKRAMDTKPNLPLYQYTGTYNNEIYGRAEIIYNGTMLKLVLPNKIHADLGHWHYDTFKAKYNYEWFDPVSYTHLDVYKRQTLFHVISMPAKGLSNSFGTSPLSISRYSLELPLFNAAPIPWHLCILRLSAAISPLDLPIHG